MRRRLILFGVALVLLVATLVGLDFGASRLLSSDDIRSRVQTLTARQGIDLAFDDAAVHILPRPRLTFTGVRLGGAAPASGTVASLSVFPRMRALLAGKLEPGLLTLNGPDLRVDLSQSTPAVSPPAVAPDTRTTIATLLAGLAQRLQAEAPGLAVRIDDGTFRFVSAERTALLLASTDARFAATGDEVQIQLRCSSDLWEDLAVDTTLRLPDLTGSGTIDIAQLRGLPLVQALDPELAKGLGLTILSAKGEFSIPDPQTIALKTTGAVPTLTILRGDTQIALRVAQFAADVDIRPAAVDLRLAGVDVEAPRVRLSGTVAVDRRLPQVRVALQATDADLAALRSAVTAMAPDVDAVQQVADIVRAGQVRTLQFNAIGETAADLGKPSNFVIRGSLAKARLVVPPANVPLTDVAGDFAIAGGILRADRASGRAGKTSARDGHLRIPLISGMPDFALSCRIDADAADVPDLLQHFVFDETFRARLRDITDVRGSVAAQLGVRRTWLGWSARVDATAFDVTATDRSLGMPMHLRGGHFSYDPTRIAVVGLSGQVGQSQLTRVSGRWGLADVADVAVLAGPATVQLGDVSRVVRRYHPGLAAGTGIRDASGPVALDHFNIHVPIAPSDAWRLATSGTTTGATFATDGPLGSVTVATRFAGTRAVLGLSDTAIAWADARLTGAGCITDRGGGVPRFDVEVQGTFGPTATAALAEAAGLPAEAGSRRQVTTPDLLLVWQPGAFASIQSPLTISNGPFLDLDMQWSPHRIDVRHLVVRDNHSNATIGLQMAANQLDVQFRGRLAHDTVDTLIARNQYVWGVIEGDFAARVIAGQPAAARARGSLTAEGVVVPLHGGPPAVIESITVRTEPAAVVIDSANLTWGDNHLSLAGRADLSAGSIDLDLSVTTPDLDLAPLLAASGPGGSGRSGAFRGLPHIPVRGVIRVTAERVSVRDLAWDGVTGLVRLTDMGPEALITSATYCHIGTPGTVKVTDAGLSVALLPRAQDQPLSATLACINFAHTVATGAFTLQADVSGTAPAPQLVHSLQGPLTLTARNGRIARMGWLGRVMQVLRPTSVFKGKLPDLSNEGLDYSEISVTGTLNKGTLEISEGVLKASPLTLVVSGSVNFLAEQIDLQVLASPVGTVNSLLEKIPIFGDIFGSALVSIPVSVSGPLDAPTVVPLSPTAVGDQLFGILKRTVETPVRLIQPLLPSGDSD